MEYTQNYQLPLWDKEDAVLRTDFNENNQKIDAALEAGAKIAIGSYVGTGEYGKTTPNVLTFDFAPKLIMIPYTPYAPLFIFAGESDATVQVHNVETVHEVVSWSDDGKTVSWHNNVSALNQLNFPNQRYLYIAWG